MGFSRLFGGHDQPKAAGAKEAPTKPVGADVPYWKKLPRRYEQLKRKAAEVRRRREQQEKRAKQLALQQERAQQKTGNEHPCMEDLMSPRSVCDSARAMEHGQAA
ncbi:unnamed protein product [Closterium sp. Yama58-4]|nr:unnamed protein product [Closterium sp. Yama58-4]